MACQVSEQIIITWGQVWTTGWVVELLEPTLTYGSLGNIWLVHWSVCHEAAWFHVLSFPSSSAWWLSAISASNWHNIHLLLLSSVAYSQPSEFPWNPKILLPKPCLLVVEYGTSLGLEIPDASTAWTPVWIPGLAINPCLITLYQAGMKIGWIFVVDY